MKPNFLCFTLLFELIKTEVTGQGSFTAAFWPKTGPFGVIIDFCGCLLDQKATIYRANEPTKVPDLPAEVKPPNRLKYYNLELKLKIKNDRESRRKVEAAAKRRYSSLGYGLPQVRII